MRMWSIYFEPNRRTESLAKVPLGLFRQLRRGHLKPLSTHSRAPKENYGNSALSCTVAVRYLEALLGNANVNRYLRKYHKQVLQDFGCVVEELRSSTLGPKATDLPISPAGKRRLQHLREGGIHIHGGYVTIWLLPDIDNAGLIGFVLSF
jgi:hypothetical protein